MAAYFQLISKATGEPVSFNKVDEEICGALGVDVHPTEYYVGWYNIIGMMLAFGRDFPYIREAVKGYYHETELLRVVDYLETYYGSSSWRGI